MERTSRGLCFAVNFLRGTGLSLGWCILLKKCSANGETLKRILFQKYLCTGFNQPDILAFDLQIFVFHSGSALVSNFKTGNITCHFIQGIIFLILFTTQNNINNLTKFDFMFEFLETDVETGVWPYKMM